MSIPYPSSSAGNQPRPTSPSYPSLTSASSSASSSSASSSDGEYDSDEEAAMIQEEWEENLRQFETMLSILIIPFFGRWYGRRFAYFAYDRYLKLGWTKAFLGLAR